MQNNSKDEKFMIEILDFLLHDPPLILYFSNKILNFNPNLRRLEILRGSFDGF